MSADPDDIQEIELRLLLEAIYQRYHYDFRSYSVVSVRRRVVQAMGSFGCPTLSRLQERVLHEPELLGPLLQHLTVQVSDMFRDPGLFRALRRRVVPVLMTYPSLKVWIAGCSTGEEVYSMAILLHEEGLLDRTTLYATDINGQALRIAEDGIYHLDRVPGFSRNYLEAGGKGSLSEYYTAAYGRALLDRSLRKNVVFSDHCLATDSVFAEVQLVSCRNVLIYFERHLQDRVIGLFSDSLCRKGFLALGASETLGFSSHAGAFTELAPGERIYQRKH